MPEQILDAIKWVLIIAAIAISIDRVLKDLIDFFLKSSSSDSHRRRG